MPATLVPFLVFCQALGAVIGVVTVVWGELAYLRAMRDKIIDKAERVHLIVIAHGLRFGMVLLLLASFGLVITAYQEQVVPQPAVSASYWILVAVAILIIAITWALSRKLISFAFGSALVFSGWWFLAFLTLGLFPPFTFGAAVALYVVSTAVFYAILQYIRFFSAPAGRSGGPRSV